MFERDLRAVGAWDEADRLCNVAAAVIGAVGAVAGGAIASSGSSKAAKAQVQAANDANQTQLQIYQQQRTDAEPWRQMGLQALGRLGSLYGFTAPGAGATGGFGTAPGGAMTGTGSSTPISSGGGLFGGAISGLFSHLTDAQRAQLQQTFPNLPSTIPSAPPNQTTGTSGAQPQQSPAMNMLAMDPGYQFRLQEGAKAVNTMYAGRGLLNSGAAAKAMQQYGQDYATGEFNNAYNRLSALAGIGQTVNQSNNALAQNYANNVSGNLISAGQARASSYAANGQMWGNTIAGIGGMAGNMFANRAPQTAGYSPGWSPSSSDYNYQGQY